MADLKIPNINMNSNKYIFKKKLSLRRKSKSRLFAEASLLFILSLLLVYLNYLIPNKYLLIQNLPTSLNKSFILAIDLFSNLILPPFIAICSLILFSYSFIYLYNPIEDKEKIELINAK